MAELLTQLTKKARLECEEAHRQQVAALNGLAGLHIIKQEVGILTGPSSILVPDLFHKEFNLSSIH